MGFFGKKEEKGQPKEWDDQPSQPMDRMQYTTQRAHCSECGAQSQIFTVETNHTLRTAYGTCPSCGDRVFWGYKKQP